MLSRLRLLDFVLVAWTLAMIILTKVARLPQPGIIAELMFSIVVLSFGLAAAQDLPKIAKRATRTPTILLWYTRAATAHAARMSSAVYCTCVVLILVCSAGEIFAKGLNNQGLYDDFQFKRANLIYGHRIDGIANLLAAPGMRLDATDCKLQSIDTRSDAIAFRLDDTYEPGLLFALAVCSSRGRQAVSAADYLEKMQALPFSLPPGYLDFPIHTAHSYLHNDAVGLALLIDLRSKQPARFKFFEQTCKVAWCEEMLKALSAFPINASSQSLSPRLVARLNAFGSRRNDPEVAGRL